MNGRRSIVRGHALTMRRVLRKLRRLGFSTTRVRRGWQSTCPAFHVGKRASPIWVTLVGRLGLGFICRLGCPKERILTALELLDGRG